MAYFSRSNTTSVESNDNSIESLTQNLQHVVLTPDDNVIFPESMSLSDVIVETVENVEAKTPAKLSPESDSLKIETLSSIEDKNLLITPSIKMKSLDSNSKKLHHHHHDICNENVCAICLSPLPEKSSKLSISKTSKSLVETKCKVRSQLYLHNNYPTPFSLFI